MTARVQAACALVCLALGPLAWALSAHAIDSGARAPELAAKDLAGQRIDSNFLRGKVVVIDFWASWCEPCREELPVLDRLHGAYRDRGLVVIGVSVDRELENVRSFLSKHPVKFPVVHDAGHELTRKFEPPTMPSSYLIDRRGVIRHVHRGYRASDGARLESQIKALLDEPAPASR